ncbi:LysR family transcriptional regulator [Dasania sp. GY-MA-18]|uniref:LysR family transcriptional regulator n=1 Tax=Dasania phycosphaerae TaxID=2950436 RepID=A0A9J6RQ19_9GAMM|nr:MULTISPECIES: LysR family transcriptional regulator [Dasania]MCR8923830.1 LysR family transcriptional regulator [Dasania sp. GY-MA-18]MCZ0866264.1 LysR family transcriptional regulator [Dasania phycosphaerae]MCZ0869988.1 LysR family transcriptional regulator [Dasania phycosphaerae]
MPLSIKNLIGRLTFRQLQIFKAVYELQSYSKAGDLLGLTQPAVSSQIRQLEQALEQTLFEYVGRRLFYTAAGERLALSINTIFTELGDLQTDMAALKGQVAGELKLVAVNTAQYVVPYMLRAFLNLHPQINVSVKVVNRATALQRLSDNSDDLVIMAMVPNDKPFTSLPFLDNELVPVLPQGHPLLQQASISPQEFLDSQLLMREPGSGNRLALELHCQQQRLRIKPSMELGSNDAIKHAVMAGLGVAVLPKLSILPELELGKLNIANIAGFPLRRSWCVVYPQAKHLTPSMQAFLDYIQQNIKQFEQIFIN